VQRWSLCASKFLYLEMLEKRWDVHQPPVAHMPRLDHPVTNQLIAFHLAKADSAAFLRGTRGTLREWNLRYSADLRIARQTVLSATH
jgi:hypothetical protein